jgi:glycosyltransferase involved in cell wall biosynthesis
MQNKLFLINSLTSGGAEKVVSVLLDEINKEKNHITLLCIENNNFYKLNSNTKVEYLTNSNGQDNTIIKFINIFKIAYKLKQYIEKNNIKIVQSHLYRANFINILSKLFGSNHITQIVNHGIVSLYQTKGILGKINLLFIKYLYPKADLIIFISKVMKLDFEKLYKTDNKKIVINNPYNIDDILNKSQENITFDFKKNKKYILSVGRLIGLKRNQDIIYALQKLPNEYEIIFLGNGEKKEELINLSKKLGLNHRIHFEGNVNNPYAYMKNSYCLILSSQSEGFPNILIEALATCLPIISTDCISGPREILAPNTNINKQLKNDIEIAEYGILYPIDNVKKLVEAIILLSKDKILRKKYTERSFKRATTFSVEKIIKKYKKVLEID